MRRFVLGWKVLGYEQRFDAHIVNYADDFVICCRPVRRRSHGGYASDDAKLKLTVNETKTRQCRVPDESFDFLGYTIGRVTRRRRAKPTLARVRRRRRSSRSVAKSAK